MICNVHEWSYNTQHGVYFCKNCLTTVTPDKVKGKMMEENKPIFQKGQEVKMVLNIGKNRAGYDIIDHPVGFIYDVKQFVSREAQLSYAIPDGVPIKKYSYSYGIVGKFHKNFVEVSESDLCKWNSISNEEIKVSGEIRPPTIKKLLRVTSDELIV